NKLMPWKRDPSATEGQRTFPLLVWEGELYQDMNSVVIIPSIWEDDETPTGAEVETNYFPALQLATTPIQQAQIKKVGQFSVSVAGKVLLFTKASFANTQ